jgi:hypothetical protein
MDQQNQTVSIIFTRDELQILKEALWNYQLETDKSSRKVAFKYLKGVADELILKSKMSKALAEKIKDL